MNLDSFQLGNIVIHDVPRTGDENQELLLTDAPVALDAELRGYFRRKVVDSLKKRGLEVVADETASPVIRNAIAEIARDPTRLVASSQAMAEHLDASQNRRNPAGLLAVGLGETDDGPTVAVLKLEREQGLRLRIQMLEERRVVDLEYLRDLTLTEKTKIFKTSLLRAADPRDAASMYGRVSDDQRGREDGTGVATFFLSTFLGCRLRTNPAKATQDFVRAAEVFFNADVSSPERRARYIVALLAKMDDQTLDIRPADFAEASLEAFDRPRFLEKVAEQGLDPNIAFEKDTSLTKVRGFKLIFGHGMVLIGGREDLADRVDLPADNSAASRVTVNDTVERLTGR
jgi:hypothetical protein